MSDVEALVKRYVATWAEPDADLRRKAIAEIWAEDGVYLSPSAEFRGHSGIEEAVTNTYEFFVPKGFGFRVAKIDINHETARYQWEVVPTAGGEPTMAGTQFVTIGPDGRMVRDYQYIDKPLSN